MDKYARALCFFSLIPIKQLDQFRCRYYSLAVAVVPYMVSVQRAIIELWMHAKHERSVRVVWRRRKPSATLVLSKSPKCIHNAIVARCTLTISFITLRLFKRRRPRLRLSYVIMLKRFTIFWALSKLDLFNPVSSVPIFARSARTSVCCNLRFSTHFRSFRILDVSGYSVCVATS